MNKVRKTMLGILSICLAFCLVCLCHILITAIAEDNLSSDNKKSDVFETFSIEQVIDNYDIPAYAAHSSSVGSSSSDKGIAMLTSSVNASFTYKNPIRMDGLTEETNLIEVFALAGGDYAGLTNIRITLTDVENEKNTFTARYYVYSSGAVYCLLDYQGKSIAWSSEGNKDKLWNGNYGAWVPGNGFTGLDNSGNVATDAILPYGLWINYEEKQVFCSYGSNRHMLMDLDDVAGVGKGGIWNGFESGMAKLSVSFELSKATLGGVFVKSVLGYNLDGEFTSVDDYDAPSIIYLMPNEYLEKMPNGGVGVAYDLPEIYASDWYFGKCSADNVSVTVIDQLGNDLSSQITDNRFVATEAGQYKIRYIANNPKRSSQSELSFEVIDELPPIVITATSDFTSSEILTQTKIPSIEVFGGSGMVSLTETLYYNGQQKEINSTRSLFLDKPGTVSLKVQAKGYTGDVAVKYYTLVVENATVLSVSNMPMILQSGTQVIFPEATAYNSATLEKSAVEIFVDGEKLNNDRKYSVSKDSGSVIVEYKTATDEFGQNVKTFEIPVVSSITLMPSDMMLVKEGDISVEDSSMAINLTSTTSFAESYWAYPVVTGNGSVNSIISLSGYTVSNQVQNGGFDYVDITYSNYANTTETMFIRIYRACDVGKEVCYLQVNGVGTKYLIDGNLSVPNLPINIYIDTAKGYVYDAVKFTPICPLDGYSASVSVIGFRFGNVSGSASVSLIQLSNQRMSSTSSWFDNNMPVISFSDKITTNMEMKRGEYVKIPAAIAYDMLSDGATVGLKITAPDGTVVIELDDASEGYSLLAEQKGYYRVQFLAEDYLGNKDNSAIYNYYAYDNISPLLTITGSINEKIKVGSTIIVPKATVSDNLGEDCSVLIYLRDKGNYNEVVVKSGDSVKFNSVGKYELVFITRDSDYNFTQYVMPISVEEQV